MKTPSRFLRIFWCGILGFSAALIFLGVCSRMERTPLPNGLELGRRYIWDGRYAIYLWTKDGNLVAPYKLDLLCYNDRYMDASTIDGPAFFLYSLEKEILTLSSDLGYYRLSREIDLNCSPEDTTGYTQFHVGAALIVLYPERVRDCTLSDPCSF